MELKCKKNGQIYELIQAHNGYKLLLIKYKLSTNGDMTSFIISSPHGFLSISLSGEGLEIREDLEIDGDEV